jgi:hypothetical protein
MKYDTHNLDEAAYLALQGYDFTVTRAARSSALFSFEKNEEFDTVRTRFWKGEVTVQLHLWLATRAALKNESLHQVLPAKRVSSPPLAPVDHETQTVVPPGSRYWFYADDGTIKCEAFGNRSLHTSRFDRGNFYPTREDAKANRNARQLLHSE